MAKKSKDYKKKVLADSTSTSIVGDLSFGTEFINKEKLAWILLAFFLLIIIVLRLRILGVPLERDEGEYAYMAQLMLKGHAPYSLAYNMKYPGTALMYAVFISLFGATAKGIHLGLLITNLFSIILTFLIGRRLFDNTSGLISAISFGVFTLSYSLLGFAFHATHLVVLFALLGIWFLLRASESEQKMLYFWSGLLLGLAMIMKQSGAAFLVFGFVFICYQLYNDKKYNFKDISKTIIPYSVGTLLPVVLMFVTIYLSGAFSKFWFWTFTYLKEYGTKVSWSRGWELFLAEISTQSQGKYLLLICVLLGLISLFLKNILPRRSKIFILTLLFFSILSVVPGLYFRSHYFVTLVPSVSFLLGGFLYFINNNSSRSFKYINIIGVLLISLGLLTSLWNDKEYLIEMHVNDISRTKYGMNPFPESLPIAKYIKANTTKNDRIAVLGSEPQIYFYADRIGSTGYIYTYNMMEPHQYKRKMQEEMASEITANPPKYIVYVIVPTSWTRSDDSETYIFSWIDKYITENYEKVGVVDMLARDRVDYIWDNEALNYQNKSTIYINVYRKK